MGRWLARKSGNSPLNARHSTSSRRSSSSPRVDSARSTLRACGIMRLQRCVRTKMRVVIVHQPLQMLVSVLDEQAPDDARHDFRRAVFEARHAVANRAEARHGAVVEYVDAAEP